VAAYWEGEDFMPVAMLTPEKEKVGLHALPQRLIAGDLDQVEQILAKSLAPFRKQFGPLVKHLNHYRGKRLRPTLVLLIAHACGRLSPAHLTLAAVVEMIHTATLVHDDVLDEANTRRHVRTVNAGWGNKISILLGDLLFSKAFHLSATVGDARACEWIGDATNRVCAGELRQTTEQGNLHLSESDYFEIIDGKTAALTECCGRLGGHFAGATARQVQALADFGRDLGMAFQIADDVLDLTGNDTEAGKTLGTDLLQRKLTLPLIYMFDRLTSEQADRLRMSLDPTAIHRWLRDTGSLESAQARAQAFADSAVSHLKCLPTSPHRTMLEAIAGWSVCRQA